MSSIGSETFVSLEGLPIPLGERPEEVTRPGADGHAYRKSGKEAPEVRLRSTVDVADAATAHSKVTTYLGMRSTIVDVVDDTGETWTNVLIVEVAPEMPQKVATPVGGLNGGAYVVRARWRLRVVNVQ